MVAFPDSHRDVSSVIRQVAESALSACIDHETANTALSFRILHDVPEDVWIIQIAPASGELVGGKDDGEQVFVPIDVDLLKLSECLSSVGAHDYGSGDPSLKQEPNIRLVGENAGRRIAIQINLSPFEDEDAMWFFDVHRGEWRQPRNS